MISKQRSSPCRRKPRSQTKLSIEITRKRHSVDFSFARYQDDPDQTTLVRTTAVPILHRVVVWDKLAQFASTLSKGANIEVESQLRQRTYQKQVQVGKKTVAVDITIAEIQASAIRKLDRSGSSANSDEEDVSEAAPNRALRFTS